jgi:integrase
MGQLRRPDWKKHVTGQLEVPLMPEVETHLLSLPSSDAPAAKLCPTLAAKSTGGNRGLSRMFQRVMAAAGIYSDRGVEKRGKGRQFKTLGFHSLRHTFVSELANADIPADVRRQISGHNDEKIHERYTHLDLDTKRRALAHLRPLST